MKTCQRNDIDLRWVNGPFLRAGLKVLQVSLYPSPSAVCSTNVSHWKGLLDHPGHFQTLKMSIIKFNDEWDIKNICVRWINLTKSLQLFLELFLNFVISSKQSVLTVLVL